MNIDDLILACKKFEEEFTPDYCLVCGNLWKLNDIKKMGWQEFSVRAKFGMPLKLYKYFSNTGKLDNGKVVNYSIQALENNTVFLQAPSEFDDVYDSDIALDYATYEFLRLKEYCERCCIPTERIETRQEMGDALINALIESYKSYNDFEHAFKKAVSDKERISNMVFIQRIKLELCSHVDLGVAACNTINAEYIEYSKQLKNTFRTTCFTTTPYSQLMWGGAYADYHRGFCLEYTVLPENDKYKDIFLNLFPMIYCKSRLDITEKLVKNQDKNITDDDLWDIYFNGALRKSIDWGYQNEWRLLLPSGRKIMTDFKVEFYPITKVFLGNRMHSEKRKEIIDICHDKAIPYVGVKRNQNLYEMQDCQVLCENCPNYLSGLNTKVN
jgi:hypothetical protein